MKHHILDKITLELIQFVAGSKAFHSRIQKMIIDVQELIYSCSLNKISLSCTPMDTKMSLEAIGTMRFKGFGV